jgi:hypothetical protein
MDATKQKPMALSLGNIIIQQQLFVNSFSANDFTSIWKSLQITKMGNVLLILTVNTKKTSWLHSGSQYKFSV